VRELPPVAVPPARAAAYGVALVRAAYGAVLLGAPGAAIRLCTGRPASSRARATARVLGARHLTQAALTAAAPGAVALATGAVADLAHCVSMLAIALADQRLRPAALADGTVAALFAAAGAAGASRDAGHITAGIGVPPGV